MWYHTQLLCLVNLQNRPTAYATCTLKKKRVETRGGGRGGGGRRDNDDHNNNKNKEDNTGLPCWALLHSESRFAFILLKKSYSAAVKLKEACSLEEKL